MTNNAAGAYGLCIRYLALRPRSRYEIQCYLEKKGYLETEIEAVLQRLDRDNLLDDNDFAAMHVASRQRVKPKSSYALSCELRRKGIDETIISRALADADDRDAAWQAIQAKARSWQRLPPGRFKNKLYHFLRYRGFSTGVIFEIWEKARGVFLEKGDADEG